MIANDIVKDKGPVFFHPISRQANQKKVKWCRIPRQLVRDIYGLIHWHPELDWDGPGTMMQRAVTLRVTVTERVLCMVIALDSNNRENVIGFWAELIYAVAIAWLMFSLRNCAFYGVSIYSLIFDDIDDCVSQETMQIFLFHDLAFHNSPATQA